MTLATSSVKPVVPDDYRARAATRGRRRASGAAITRRASRLDSAVGAEEPQFNSHENIEKRVALSWRPVSEHRKISPEAAPRESRRHGSLAASNRVGRHQKSSRRNAGADASNRAAQESGGVENSRGVAWHRLMSTSRLMRRVGIEQNGKTRGMAANGGISKCNAGS